MRQVLQRAWLRRGAAARLLWPAAQVFGMIAALRRLGYRTGFFKSEHMPVPVVVVGNVTAGGSGKTPVVMSLLEHLRSRGLAAGVVSRGYGRRSTDCKEVRRDSRASEVGDEPLLLARNCGVPIFVAPNRAAAARALLAAYPRTQVIVCDDGLQHYGLQRDIEICVFDARGTGNGWLLPAGPLREPWPRAVDLVVQAGNSAGIAGYEARRRLATHARGHDGKEIPLAALKDRPLTAVAGIARPDAFFQMLRDENLQLERTIALPDHHDFEGQGLDLGGRDLICTEKDAVKLWERFPAAWAVPLVVTVEPGFWSAFDRLFDAKLSSFDGPETT